MNTTIPALLVFLPLTLQTVRADDDQSGSPPPQGTFEHIVVTGVRENGDNYRASGVESIGPLGTTPILDQPYSISILPSELIENSQAVNFKDVSKYLPLVAYQEQQGPDILRPQTRGLMGGNFQNSKQDGMTYFITGATTLEQYEQLEVVNGLSASLYGPANPSGMFNFVTKRPTDDGLHEVTTSYTSDSVGAIKADFGGRIDPGGIFRYRVNGVYASGDGYVDLSHQRRVLGDIGIDVHPWDHGVIELNYSNYTLDDTGYPGWFSYGEKRALPSAPDPDRVGYGQSYAGVEMRTQILSVRIKQDLGSADNWHLVAGILNQDATRDINTAVNTLTSNSGNYTTSYANGFAPRFVITSDTAYLNGNLDTFGLSHDLTFGTAGYRASSYTVRTPATAASVLLGTASIDSPELFPQPVDGSPNTSLNYDSSDAYEQGINVNDLVRWTDQWSVRAGVSQDWFHTNNFNKLGVRTTEYADHGVSPSGSLMFKPASNMTAYFTYASALQAGDLAPGTATNAGVGLPPYRSKEYELGYKIDLAKINLTAALFRIERPFANTNPADGVFEISGQQVNRGAEFSAIGEFVSGLTLAGGIQLLDARLEHTPLAATNNQIYVGAPKVKGNVLLEYAIPELAGLVATFDYQFTGPRPANDANSFFVAGYNLFDIGARYNATVRNTPVILRLAVDNIADRHYWSTIAPSNLTGANTGSLLAYLGSPRTVLASLSVKF